MKIRNKQTGQIIEVTEDQLADYGLDTMAKGGMIKRADGSYSRRGLWDNIRANKGSGKKPTKAMLAQEKKIRAAEKAYGGYMDMGGYMNPYMAYGGYLPMAQEGNTIPISVASDDYLMRQRGMNNYNYWLNDPSAVLVDIPEPVDYLQTKSGLSRYLQSLPEERMGMLNNDEYVQKIANVLPYSLYPYSETISQNFQKPKTKSSKKDTKTTGATKSSGNSRFSNVPVADTFKNGGCMQCGGRMESGGKIPKEVLLPRLESHMSPKQAHDYLNTYGMGGYLDEAGDGKWIQKATASIKRRGTEGVCTGSKFGGPGCPPGSKRYNLAKTFRKMAKSKKEEGGYTQGGEYEMTDAEIAKLRSMGYKIKEV